jgi:hypothetical protein
MIKAFQRRLDSIKNSYMTMADSEVKRANANNIPVTFKQLT